jgi:hypothetical protein
MTIEEIFELYKKERKYETELFGDYKNLKELSFPSFINFLRTYLRKIESSYTENWEGELPPWLIQCQEFYVSGSAPVKAYAELIKLFALAGAALETYAKIDVEKWREHKIKFEE